MKRTIVILSSILVLAVLALTSTTQAQPNPNADKLSKDQLSTLIATAKTPADHNRIAQYYGAEAKNLLAESKEHQQMAEQFKKNPMTSSSKYATGTVNHCEYLAQYLKESAAAMQTLANDHEQMAKEAGKK